MTALCAALNLEYFLYQALSAELPARRAAAMVLALISFGTLAESLVIIGSVQTNGIAAFGTPAAWVVARTFTLAGTGLISALVLRAIGRRK